MNWDDLRFFLAVVRHKTLMSAAKDLGVTQSTVRRRIAAFQDGLGTRLLARSSEGYVPTAAGKGILVHIERVEAEALSAERAVLGLDKRLDGYVRIAASQMLTSHVLAPISQVLQATHSEIAIDMVPEAAFASPSPGDPDIAMRLRRFENVDLVVHSIGMIAFGLYGSLEHLATTAKVDFTTHCRGQKLITLLEERAVSAQDAWLTENVGQAKVSFRADSYESQYWACRHGCGLALLPRFQADLEPELRRIPVATPIPPANIWVGVHREGRLQPRVQVVLDCVKDVVRRRSVELNPYQDLDAA